MELGSGVTFITCYAVYPVGHIHGARGSMELGPCASSITCQELYQSGDLALTESVCEKALAMLPVGAQPASPAPASLKASLLRLYGSVHMHRLCGYLHMTQQVLLRYVIHTAHVCFCV